MWPQAKYRRSREHFEGATGYVAKPNITVSWNRSMKDMEEKSRRDRDWESRNPPIGGAGGQDGYSLSKKDIRGHPGYVAKPNISEAESLQAHFP